MADIYSVVSATAGLLDITVRLVKYARELKRSSGTIEGELDSLIEEARMLEGVCNIVNASYDRSFSRSQRQHSEKRSGGRSPDATQGLWQGLWQDIAQIISHCRLIVQRIYDILIDISQPPPQGLPKHADKLVKAHRKRSKKQDLQQCRSELSLYHSSMQLVLAIINREEEQRSKDNTVKSFENLAAQLGIIQSHISGFGEFPSSTGDARYDKEALSALRDLETTISNATKLIAPPTTNKYFKTPQAVSSIFTGREKLLQELRHGFIQSPEPLRNQMQRRFVVYGLGGSGKTQFCCKFAEDNRERFWGVFSIDGSSVKSIKKSLGDIAKLAGRHPNADAALDWLSTVKEQWLLLFDNADDNDVEVENYFPKGIGGHILITTRNRAIRVLGNVEPAYYDFSGLRFDEASSLLLKASSLPRPWAPLWESLALNITEVLGHLALAIVHAGAAIRDRLCSLHDYLGWYKRYWESLRDNEKVQHATSQEAAIWTTFEICYQRLEQKQDRTEAADAIELLHVFAFLYRDDLSPKILTKALRNIQLEAESEKTVATVEGSRSPQKQSILGEKVRQILEPIFTYVVGANMPPPLPSVLRDGRQMLGLASREDRIRGALRELEKLSLIYYNENRETYTMHPVVHKWARDRPRMKLGYQALWADIASQTIASSILLPPLTGTEDELHHASLFPHIDHIQTCRAEINTKVDLRSHKSRLPRLMKVYPVNAHRVRMSAKFGLVYAQCGDFRKAQQLFAEVVASLTSTLGLGSPRTRAAQTALAAVYWEQGKVDEALDLQQNIATTCEEYLGREHPDTLRALHKLSVTLWQQGRYNAARKLQVEVVGGLKKALGTNHVDTLEAMNNLGNTVMKFYRKEDKLEAFELLSEAVKGMRELLGNEHLLATYAKENLARASCLMDDQDLLSPALQLMREVVATRKAKMGKEAPWTLMALGNMAIVLGAQGHYEQAERVLTGCLAIVERNKPVSASHIGVLFGKQILATMLNQQERYNEAEKILTNLIHDQRDMSSRSHDFHPDRIVSMVELARCYERQGKLRKSIDICNETIRGMENTAKDGHPFIGILKEARHVMERVVNDASADGTQLEATVEVRFPEWLFKVY
ncbi:tetratricopeptide repeat domain-containing protein [Astrocystis sublimbata]|nr:tetratricopeptide repeat domain-containing protein [Astrocystis sublimbata]